MQSPTSYPEQCPSPERCHRRDRSRICTSRRLRLLALLFVVACSLMILLVIDLFQARQNMLEAAVTLHSSASLTTLASLHKSRSFERIRSTLVTAEGDLTAAQERLLPLNPILSRLGRVPVVGPQLSAAPGLCGTALDATRAAIHLVDGLAPAETVLARTGSPSPLRVLVPSLGRGAVQFRLARRFADRAQVDVAGLSPHTGDSVLDAVIHQLRVDVPIIVASSRWLAVSPALLGLRGPSTELILVQDPRELRATGGFIGAAGMATLEDGHARIDIGSSVLPHEITSVAPPSPEVLYTPESTWLFRDSNWSPDFPLSARLARWFYGRDTGHWAGGVIAIQSSAVPPLLALTGPVYLPAYSEWVDAGNVAALADRYINGSYHGPSRSGGTDDVRKQFVGAVLAAVLPRIEALPIVRWPSLATLLSRETNQGEILLYDRRPQVEAAIRSIHADGAFLPVRGDMLAIVDDNRSYNKINPYVREQVAYTVRIRPDLTIDASLHIRYHVLPSPSDLEGCSLCSLTGNTHDYQDFLRVFVPNGAEIETVTGMDLWKPRLAYGMMQVAGRVLAHEGQTHPVTIRYRLPANVFQSTAFQRYRLTVWHQPGTSKQVGVRIEGIHGVHIDGREFVQTNFQSTSDRRIEFSITGAVTPRTIDLPAVMTKDPYVPRLP